MQSVARVYGQTLADLFEDAKTAEDLITALNDEAAKAVGKDIAAHATLWAEMPAADKTAASSKATAWATSDKGHKAQCPACRNDGLVKGFPQGAVTTKVNDDDAIVQKRAVIPSSFECLACGLKVMGLSKLAACGLGNTFTTTSISSAAEHFGLYTEDDMDEARSSMPDFDDDNNE